MLLDREVDCVTPMCTQLTFEGLVDETLGIKNGSVTLDAASGGQHLPVLTRYGFHINANSVGFCRTWYI